MNRFYVWKISGILSYRQTSIIDQGFNESVNVKRLEIMSARQESDNIDCYEKRVDSTVLNLSLIKADTYGHRID